MQLELPYPPSVNHYWFVNGKRRFIGKRGKEYRARVDEIVTGYGRVPGKISFWIYVYPPDRRKRDLDNLPKCILDSLVFTGTIDDDSNIDELHLIRKEIIKEGKVVVTINPL